MPPSERPLRTQVSLTPWREPVQAACARVHLLSNGRYGVLITSAGRGLQRSGGTWR